MNFPLSLAFCLALVPCLASANGHLWTGQRSSALLSASLLSAGELKFTKFGEIEKHYHEIGQLPPANLMLDLTKLDRRDLETKKYETYIHNMNQLAKLNATSFRCYTLDSVELAEEMSLGIMLPTHTYTSAHLDGDRPLIEFRGYAFTKSSYLSDSPVTWMNSDEKNKGETIRNVGKHFKSTVPSGQTSKRNLDERLEVRALTFEHGEAARAFQASVRVAQVGKQKVVLLKDVLLSSKIIEDAPKVGKAYRYCIGEID